MKWIHRMGTAVVVTAVAAALSIGVAPAERLSEPVAHGAVTVYFTYDEATGALAKALSVEEAVETGTVEIVDIGNVRRLLVRNRGDTPVFLQMGDLLKGGMQDRVIETSTLVLPYSETYVSAYCVELGRWLMLGSEDRFLAQGFRLPGAADVLKYGQDHIWDSVARMQGSLAMALGYPVVDGVSSTSLPRTLEMASKATDSYVAALGKAPPQGATGYVAVANGRVVAADRFGSSELLRKLWPKLVRAAAFSSMVATSGPGNVRSGADVQVFLDSAIGTGSVSDLTGPGEELVHRAFVIGAGSAPTGTWERRSHGSSFDHDAGSWFFAPGAGGGGFDRDRSWPFGFGGAGGPEGNVFNYALPGNNAGQQTRFAIQDGWFVRRAFGADDGTLPNIGALGETLSGFAWGHRSSP